MSWSLPAELPVHPLQADQRIARMHRVGSQALFFGPVPEEPPSQRFHDPLGIFRACFLGADPTASFAETFLRRPPIRLITREELGTRSLSTARVTHSLRLAQLYGPGLARLGCTADVTSSLPPYTTPQGLARALYEHADGVDGLAYLCRHDNRRMAFAVFDRGRDDLERVATEPLLRDEQRLLDWSRTYGFAIG